MNSRCIFSALVNVFSTLVIVTLLFFFIVEWRRSSSRRQLQEWLRSSYGKTRQISVSDSESRQKASQKINSALQQGSALSETTDGRVSSTVGIVSLTVGRVSSAGGSVSLGVVKPELSTTALQSGTVRNEHRTGQTSPGKSYHLLVIVLSASKFSERRAASRLVWRRNENFDGELRMKNFYKYIFVCGKSRNRVVAQRLLREQEAEADIVQADVSDAYVALTEKVLWSMRWALSNFQFRYLLKTDDDVFVDLAKLFVQVPWNVQSSFYKGCTAGRKPPGVRVQRARRSKWYVPKAVYQPDFYPPYNQGHGYLLSRDVVQTCLQRAALRPMINVEDAFVGVLLFEANVTARHDPHVHDRPYGGTCKDELPLIIGGVRPAMLRQMALNLKEGRHPCWGVRIPKAHKR